MLSSSSADAVSWLLVVLTTDIVHRDQPHISCAESSGELPAGHYKVTVTAEGGTANLCYGIRCAIEAVRTHENRTWPLTAEDQLVPVSACSFASCRRRASSYRRR